MRSSLAVRAASLAAMATIAQFVIGKATRDALFLSHFPAVYLPYVMIAGATLSAGAVIAQTGLLRRDGPFAFVPLAFGAHALLALAECTLSAPFPRLVAVLVYLHTAAAGPALISAFWAAVSEAFDPHTARHAMGRIGAGATLGGVLGGGLAWLGARVVPVPVMLVLVAVFSAIAARSVRALGAAAVASPSTRDTDRESSHDGAVYLRWLAALVVLGAVVQSLVEYALGVTASASFGTGPRLLAFFALFQASIGMLSFVLQLGMNRLALEKLGVGATLALLPAGVVLAGGMTLAFPSLLGFIVQRGAEGALRASLHRSAYEILFSPVAPHAKRRAKTIIDVGCDRVGMIAGSALTLLVIARWPASSAAVATAIAIACAASELLVVNRLQLGYVTTLAERLRSGAVVLHPDQPLDATTRRTLSTTTAALDRDAILAQVARLQSGKAAPLDPSLVLALARRELEAIDGGRRHVTRAFELWSLIYPREALQLADAALRSADPSLQGIALEYLAAVLPREDQQALERRLDASPVDKRRSMTEALAELQARRDVLDLSDRSE